MFRKIGPVLEKIYEDKKWLTISNLLTILRIILIPFIVSGIFCLQWGFVFLLFLIAGLSDILDGYLARLLNQESNLGKVLDPIADKLLTLSSFFSLAFLNSPSFLIPKWIVFLFLVREICIVAGSYLIMLLGIELEIVPTVSGKLNTFFQLTFILWLFVCHFFSWSPAKTYYILLAMLALFALASLLQYIKIGFDYLKKNI